MSFLNPFTTAKNSIAKEVVKKRIKAISKSDEIPAQRIYAVIDVLDEFGDFKIWLYSKDDLSKPIREIGIEELL